MSIERDDPGDEIRTLQDLTDEERNQTRLVKISKRTERLQGDPYGTWQHWAGNLNHPEDDGMVRRRWMDHVFHRGFTDQAASQRS